MSACGVFSPPTTVFITSEKAALLFKAHRTGEKEATVAPAVTAASTASARLMLARSPAHSHTLPRWVCLSVPNATKKRAVVGYWRLFRLDMSEPPHVAGLILARGGSQGIPLKNLAPLGERPLLEWALGAMLNFGGFDSLWVSTDHPGIATCATGQGALVFPRSAKYAGPEAASIDAVIEFLQSHPEVDVVALVQCTSPFLRPGGLISITL